MNELKNVSSIRPKREVKFGISLFEVMFVIVVTVIAAVVRGIVYPLFEYPFVILTFLNATYLVMKPKENPTLNHLQMFKLVIRRYLFKEYVGYKTIDVREFRKE